MRVPANRSLQPPIAAVAPTAPTAPVATLDDEQLLSFDDLTPVEQAAASLGVQPGAIKPIGWLNDAHFQTLKDNNALHPELSRRIEAFRYVSRSTTE